MIKSIQQFEEIGVKKLGKVLEDFIKIPENQAEFVYGVTDAVIRLGLDIIKETFESMDEELRASGLRKSSWVISRLDETSLITSLGT
ncbi:MAG: ISLre2 family transposase, partial [Lachnospiraceae bacterium]